MDTCFHVRHIDASTVTLDIVFQKTQQCRRIRVSWDTFVTLFTCASIKPNPHTPFASGPPQDAHLVQSIMGNHKDDPARGPCPQVHVFTPKLRAFHKGTW